MRSTEEDPPTTISREERRALARRFGVFLTAAAERAGYDVRQRAGGRAQLANRLGVAVTTVSRALDGESIPLPSQQALWAKVLGVDHHQMMVESGLIRDETGPKAESGAVASLTPDAAMDSWEITDPIIRRMLAGAITQARDLQREIAAAARGAEARG
ncbi:multiprotein-bridging factor 1 family protein [Streptomyces sp. NPDC091385]|uniref:helix-turn-helix domain-containing protein n=1 Tax=Streptomyces sp. NPDC091385 TaxID=3365997 RepID=UPI0038185259